VGAEVRVRTEERIYRRLIHSAASYLCSGDVRAHFGLGQAERTLDVEVLWPDGSKETFAGGPVDREIKLLKGSGSSLPAGRAKEKR
jgi:hypothetical protein